MMYGGRDAATGAAALNGRPTSILIVAPALLARDNRKRRLVMQIVRIGLNLANMFS